MQWSINIGCFVGSLWSYTDYLITVTAQDQASTQDAGVSMETGTPETFAQERDGWSIRLVFVFAKRPSHDDTPS